MSARRVEARQRRDRTGGRRVWVVHGLVQVGESVDRREKELKETQDCQQKLGEIDHD